MSSEPIYGDLLENLVLELMQLGFKMKGYNTDETHQRFAAHLVATGEPLPFMLVAKGSKLFKEVVSTQRSLIETWKGPLVLGWIQGDSKEFYVFDPEAILLREHWSNWLAGVEFFNFSVFSGAIWQPQTQSLNDVWQMLKKKTWNLKGLRAY